MNNLSLINENGELYADSRDVAEAIEREHSKLLRTIREYCGFLTEAKIGLSDFFVEATYEDRTGRKLPRYLITKKGCDMIANKLTGKKGVLFTAAYVTAFEQMKEQLESQKTIGLTPGKVYPVKATSIGEVVNLIKVFTDVMKDEGCSPSDMAEVIECVCFQFGISIPKSFIRKFGLRISLEELLKG